jgi:WD40 repeat protein
MNITADGEKFLVGDSKGHLKLVSLRDGELIKNFGRAHDSYISGIIITPDQKFFITSSFHGELKQWNYEDNTLVTDHGKITNHYIRSFCS